MTSGRKSWRGPGRHAVVADGFGAGDAFIRRNRGVDHNDAADTYAPGKLGMDGVAPSF